MKFQCSSGLFPEIWHCRKQVALSALTCLFPPFESWKISCGLLGDVPWFFLSAIVSQNRLNPIMQRAKNDRAVLKALPVYDNGNLFVVSPFCSYYITGRPYAYGRSVWVYSYGQDKNLNWFETDNDHSAPWISWYWTLHVIRSLTIFHYTLKFPFVCRCSVQATTATIYQLLS